MNNRYKNRYEAVKKYYNSFKVEGKIFYFINTGKTFKVKEITGLDFDTFEKALTEINKILKFEYDLKEHSNDN